VRSYVKNVVQLLANGVNLKEIVGFERSMNDLRSPEDQFEIKERGPNTRQELKMLLKSGKGFRGESKRGVGHLGPIWEDVFEKIISLR